ncbi:hypothetical protein CEXT_85201 [Caerostris extrusa]|uniref:Uncharacterized protein n=1 Tax=Caerostris extrusa TaxID=172846 RepID=A0AAV4WTZ7_CAEEX|nr:hypothetical protein CEXT_85201 [Caerostris extrusa]
MDPAFIRKEDDARGKMIKHIIAQRQIKSNIGLIHSLLSDMNYSNSLACTNIQNVSIAITGNMACENPSWINPCGLTTDEVDASFDNTSIDDLNKRIVDSAEVFSSQLNELRNYMIKTFPDIDEESLISHEFSFLKTQKVLQRFMRISSACFRNVQWLWIS